MAPLLLEYRQVPQQSMGFPPFELLHGRYVRGPMDVLKELWTKEGIGEDVKTTYGDMLEFRSRQEDTCKAANEELRRQRYDRSVTTTREAVSGMSLLESGLSFCRPQLTINSSYNEKDVSVLKRINKVDYVIDLEKITSN